jgi:hypothetical protein
MPYLAHHTPLYPYPTLHPNLQFSFTLPSTLPSTLPYLLLSTLLYHTSPPLFNFTLPFSLTYILCKLPSTLNLHLYLPYHATTICPHPPALPYTPSVLSSDTTNTTFFLAPYPTLPYLALTNTLPHPTPYRSCPAARYKSIPLIWSHPYPWHRVHIFSLAMA